MSAFYTVALVGFSSGEAATLESFFRLAARRPPGYRVQRALRGAQLLIVNADHPQALQQVRQFGPPVPVLLLGHHDGDTGWPLQRKPVKLVAVLHELDRLAVSTAGAQRPPQAGFAATQIMMNPAAQHRAAASPPPGVVRLTDFAGLEDLPSPVSAAPSARARSAPPVQRGDVLLVAEHLADGRLLHKRLQRYGLRIDWAREAEQALSLLQAHAYRLVVIDRLDGQPDAHQLCRAAKQTRQANGQPPVVFLFAPGVASMDRIRAGLAGCDAYLPHAVGEADLFKLLAQQRLVNLDAFSKTNVGF